MSDVLSSSRSCVCDHVCMRTYVDHIGNVGTRYTPIPLPPCMPTPTLPRASYGRACRGLAVLGLGCARLGMALVWLGMGMVR